MTAVAGVNPQFSATRAGGESVTITGADLDQVTSVSFGPFDGLVQHRAADELVVTAPDYRPGHGGSHGEVIVWVDAEPVHSGVVWTWEGKSLDELGGPLDAIDSAVAFGSVPGAGAPQDAVDEALQQHSADPAATGGQPAFVSGFTPTVLRRGGGWITIKGHGFTGATGVTLGSNHPCEFRVDSDTQVVALVPAYSLLDLTVDSTLPSSPFVWHGDEMAASGSLPEVEWQLDADSTITFGAESAEPTLPTG